MTDECRYPLYMKNDYAKVLNYNESIFFPFFISEEKIHKFSELLLFPVSNPTLELREHRIITLTFSSGGKNLNISLVKRT